MSSTVANLPSGAPAADTDIVYTVKDPSGTPSDAKLALSDIKDYVLSGGGGGAVGPTGAVQFSDGAGALDYSQYIIASDDGAGTQRLNVGDEAVVQFTGLFKVATGSGFFADFSDTDASGYHSYVDVYAPKAEFSPRISLEGIKADFPTEITGIVRIKIPEPATSAGNYFYTLTLPDSPGASGQVLSTDGTGVLSWVDPAGGTAPATASSTGRAGEIRYDSSYVYVCVATNTWKRAALSTW